MKSSRPVPSTAPSQPTALLKEAADIIARHTKGGMELSTAIDGLYFGSGIVPTEPIHLSQWPCFALVAQGEKSVTVGDETFLYGVGDYVIVTLDLPVISRVTKASAVEPYLGLGMVINLDRLKEMIGRVPVRVVALGRNEMLGVSVNQATSDLLTPTLRLLRLLDRPDDIPVMAPLIEQEILFRLLQGPAGSRLLSLLKSETPTNRIAAAIAWLRANFRDTLQIADMADQVGMSVSSLHHHFKSVTAMSPIQFQKNLRLQEARRLMLIDRLDVGNAGFAVGYHSPSQFSREYSRFYGVSPSQDAKSSRLVSST